MELSSIAAIALVVGGVYLLITGKRPSFKELLENEKTLNEVKNLDAKKKEIDQQLKDEENKRSSLNKQNEEEKKKDDSNEDLSKFFNDR